MEVARAVACAALFVACAGKGTSTPRRDAGDAGAGTAAALTDANIPSGPTPAGAAAPYGLAPTDTDGGVAGSATLSIKVQWPTAPADVRASPGYTSCHTPRRARARIGTLHGVAGAMVVLDGINAGKPPPATAKPVRVTVRDCSVDPVAVAAARLGGVLEIQTQDTAHAVTVVRTGKPWLEDDGILAPVTLASAQLPIIGHTIAVSLDEPGAIRVSADGADDDAAWVLAPPHPYAGLTDEVGQLSMHGVPPGTYTLVAWLPPAAGMQPQRAVANVTVKAGTDADVTITFGPPAPTTTPDPPPGNDPSPEP